MPIVVEGEVWGEVWATTAPGSPRFTGRDVRFLEAIAGQLGGVVARGEMFSRVSRLAYEDELTGLSNRRALDEQLAAALDAWRESGHALTLLVCDVDELKTINDERGHHAGDRALRRVGQALVKAAAPVPGRVRGPDVRRRVRRGPAGRRPGPRPAAWPPPRCGSCARSATPPCRCPAAWPPPGRAPSAPSPLMRAADAAQYAAKRRGGAPGVLRRRGRLPRAAERRRGRRPAPPRAPPQPGGADRGGLRQGAGPAGRHAWPSAPRWTAWRRSAARWRRWSTPPAGRSRSPSTATTRSGRWPPPTAATRCCAACAWAWRTRSTRCRTTRPPQRLVAQGSGTFHVDRYDRSADRAERRLLDEIGYSAVLAASATDPEGCYLVELYADGDTRELTGLAVSLSLLVRAAAANSASAMARVRAPAPPHPPHHRDQRRRPQAGGGHEPRWTPPRPWSRSCTPPTPGR